VAVHTAVEDSRSLERLQAVSGTRCTGYSEDLKSHTWFRPTQGRLSYGGT
jgi:hypothetical protein